MDSEEDDLKFDEEEENESDASKSNSQDNENDDDDDDNDEDGDGDEEDEDEDQDEDNDEDDDNEDDDEDEDKDDDEEEDDDEDDDEDKSKGDEDEEEEEEEEEEDEEEEDEDEKPEEDVEEEIETQPQPVVKKRGRKPKVEQQKQEKAKTKNEKKTASKKKVVEVKKQTKKGRKKKVEEEEMEEEADQEDQDEEKSDQDEERDSSDQEESMEQEDENDEDEEKIDFEDEDDDEERDDEDDEDQDKDEEDEDEDKDEEEDDDDEDDDDNISAASGRSREDIEEEIEEDEVFYDIKQLKIDPDAFQEINRLQSKQTQIYRLTDFYRYSSKKVHKLILKELKIHSNMRNRVQQDNKDYIEKQQIFSEKLLDDWRQLNMIHYDDQVPDEANDLGDAQSMNFQKQSSNRFGINGYPNMIQDPNGGRFQNPFRQNQPIQIKKNELTLQQLEQTIIDDAKASKSDYFLHFNNMKQNFQITPQMIQRLYNPISSNEFFSQLRHEMVKKIVSGENKFVPEEEEEDIVEDLYQKEYMRLNNGQKRFNSAQEFNRDYKRKKKSKFDEMGNESDYINEDEDYSNFNKDSENTFMENEDDSKTQQDSGKKKKPKKSKFGIEEEGKKKKNNQDSENKKKDEKKKKQKKVIKKKEKKKKRESNDSSMSFGDDDSDRLSLSQEESQSQIKSFSNEESKSKQSNSSDERDSGFGGSDDESKGQKKSKKKELKKNTQSDQKKTIDSNKQNAENEKQEGRKQKKEVNEVGFNQEMSDSVIINAMSIEEREISRERNRNSDIQSIDLLKIKQKQYKENFMDFQDTDFLDGYFQFDYNNKEMISTKKNSDNKGMPFQLKIGDDLEKRQNLFGEPIDMEKAPKFAPNSKIFRFTQEEKDFIHIEEPKTGNFINIQISSNSTNKQKLSEKDKQAQQLLLQQQKEGNAAFLNSHQKKNLQQKTEKLPKETFLVKRQLVSKQFDYYNSELVNCGWNQPKEYYNNILIDLNDPQFFLDKVNTFFSTQKKERKEAFFKWNQLQKKIHLEEDRFQQLNEKRSIYSGDGFDEPSKSFAPIQKEQQQYPINVKTFIEQKKRDKNEIPQRYDHSRVAKQFEFNYLTQDVNVFKDYHYWDLFQKVRIAQHQYEKQYAEQMQYMSQQQQNPQQQPLLQQSSQQNQNMVSTPKSTAQQASFVGGSGGFIQMQLPPLQSQQSSGQQGGAQQQAQTTSSNIISLPMIQPTQNLNKISIKLPTPVGQSQQKDTIVSIPAPPASNTQSQGAVSNSQNPNLITLQPPIAGKSSSIISLAGLNLTSNQSSEAKNLAQLKEKKDKTGPQDKSSENMEQNKSIIPQHRLPPVKNGLINEWKIIPQGMQASDYCLKTINPDMKSLEISEEKVESFKHFKSKRNLSLKKDIVIMLEYAEEDPLVLQNIGMNSKIFRYAYHNRIFKKMESDKKKNETLNQISLNSQMTQSKIEDQTDELDSNYKTIGQFQNHWHKQIVEGELVEFEKDLLKFKSQIQETLGELGKVIFYDESEKTNLFGQLDDQEEGKESLGITIIENHLFKAPIFRQKLPETDFLLVRQQENDKCNYFLRPIEYVYIVGQIEPTKSIYRPRSRDITPYMKNCMNTFIMIKIQKEKKVHFSDLLKNFDINLTETQIRQQIKKKNLKPELNNKNTFVPKDNEQDSDNENAHDPELTPEQACMFEKMLSHVFHLSNEIGLQELRTTEKLKNVLAKFSKDRPDDLRNYTIAKLIADKLSLTPWSLSSNFTHDKQKLYLEGLGDPTNGHGGYSFIKRPLKKRSEKDEKQEKKEEEKQKEDLRKLNITEINRILQLLGINLDAKISETKKQRWAKIDIIKKKLDEIDLTEREDLQVLMPFKRKDRKTVKEAEIHYQKKINSLFHKLIYNLSNQELPEVPQEIIDDDAEYLPLEHYMEEERKIREKKKRQIKAHRPANQAASQNQQGDESKANEQNEFSDDDAQEYDDDEEEDDEEEQDDESMSDQG